MSRDYVPRNSSTRPSTSSRRAPQGGRVGRNRRKKRAPILPIIIIALIAIVIVVVVLALNGNKDKNPNSSAVSDSSVVSVSDVSDSSDDESTDPASETSAEPTPEVPVTPPPKKDVSDQKVEALGALLVVGDTGYEYYNFVESIANDYITSIRDGADKLKGRATVYAAVVPTSMDLMLPEDFFKNNPDINTSNQKKAIEYFNSSFASNDNIKALSLYDTLNLYTDEYIFFRTDHHWTALGAYYAYKEFCEVKGITPLALTDYETKDIPGFLGSFYSDSNQSPALAANPDTLSLYFPPCETEMVITQRNGENLNWPIVYDVTDYSQGMKYNAFIGGDNPYTKITNKDLSDGSACVVLKESFGNAFVPFLTPHYENIYVIDYRYYSGNVSDIVDQTNATDVIIVNNLSMTRSASHVTDLAAMF